MRLKILPTSDFIELCQLLGWWWTPTYPLKTKKLDSHCFKFPFLQNVGFHPEGNAIGLGFKFVLYSFRCW